MSGPVPPPDAVPSLLHSFLSSFLDWIDGQDWLWSYAAVRILGDAPEVLPEIEIVPVLGPIVEQPTTTPDLTHTVVSHTKGRLILMFSLGSSQQVTLAVKFRDKRGNPAEVDGVPEWMTDNSEVVALTPSDDGLSCLVAAVGPLGVANVTMTADADLGDGTRAIVGTIEITVTAGSAAVVALEPGVAEEQPDTGTTP